MQLQTRVRAGRWLLALLAVVTLTGYAAPHPQIVQKIDENQLATLQGSVHPLAQAKFDQGAAPDALPLKQMLLLLKRDAASEQALNTAVAGQHDPSSANYHKWLTPAQFQKQYGASAADVSTLTSWLGGKGFTGIKLSAGGTVVEFSGTAGTVSSAFHTEIHQYKVNGELHYANASNPQVPAALLPAIKGLVSLNNFPHSRVG